MKRVQVGDIEYKESSALAARRNRTELDGLKTEAADAVFQVSMKSPFIFKKELRVKKLSIFRENFYAQNSLNFSQFCELFFSVLEIEI